MKALTVAMAAVVALFGCAGGAEPSGNPTPESTAPVTPVEYKNVYELREAVEAAGHECTDWSIEVAEPIYAIELANCTESTVLGIYENAARVRKALDETRWATDAIGGISVHLVGPNWAIDCGDDQSVGDRLQKALGGDLDVYEAKDN